MAYDAKLPLLLAGIPQVGDGKRAVEEGVDHLHVVAAAHHRKQRLGRGRGRPHREGGEVFVDLGPRVPRRRHRQPGILEELLRDGSVRHDAARPVDHAARRHLAEVPEPRIGGAGKDGEPDRDDGDPHAQTVPNCPGAPMAATASSMSSVIVSRSRSPSAMYPPSAIVWRTQSTSGLQ